MSRPRRRRTPRRPDLWPPIWRRRPLAVAAVLMLAAAVAWVRFARPIGSDFDRYHNRSFTWLRVVHGDTLDIAARDGRRPTTRVRLLGIDAPKATPDRQAYFAAEAADFVGSAVEGKTLRLVLPPDRTRDHYNRLLAYVYVGDSGDMLNEQLITTGHAYADPRFAHPWLERFLALEERARRRQEGLWLHVRPEHMPPWRQRLEEAPRGDTPSRWD